MIRASGVRMRLSRAQKYKVELLKSGMDGGWRAGDASNECCVSECLMMCMYECVTR